MSEPSMAKLWLWRTFFLFPVFALMQAVLIGVPMALLSVFPQSLFREVLPVSPWVFPDTSAVSDIR